MFLISLAIMGYAFSCLMTRREEYKRTQIVFAALFLFGALALQIAYRMDLSAIQIDHQSIVELMSSLITCAGFMLLVSFWIYRSRQVSYDEALYASAMAYLAQHASYCVQNLTKYFMPKGFSPLAYDVWDTGIIILSAILFYRVFSPKMIHDNHYISNIKETLPLLVVIITIVMLFSLIAVQFDFVLIHSIYGLVFCLFILSSQMERQKTLVQESEIRIREQLLVTQQAQYKIYKENADLLNVKSHDLKHQIAALRMMYDNKTGEEVINSIAGTVRIYDSFVRTGNDGLDTILTSKNQICLDKNILFTCMVDGKLLSMMDQVDLYSLFGNLMDNAIEAVEQLPEESRSISLSVKEDLGMVMISEENPYGEVMMEKGRFQTTKPDKINHGYGLQSMDIVAQKYEGTLSANAKDGIFSLNIMLYPE